MMKKQCSLYIMLGLFLVFGSLPVMAGEDAGMAVSWLNYTHSADSAALGRVHTVNSSGAVAIVHNPADLSLQKKQYLSMMHTELFEGVAQDYAGVSYQADGFALGLAYQALDVRWVQRWDEEGNFLGTFDLLEWVLTVAGSREILPGLALGGSLRLIRQLTFEAKSFGLGVNLGAKWQLGENWTLGGMVANPVSRVWWNYGEIETLPLVLRLGAAYHWPAYDLTVMGEYLAEPGEKPLHFGIEKGYKENLRFRAGLDGMTPTLGLGFKMARLEVDYAFALDKDFGKRQYLSLNWQY